MFVYQMVMSLLITVYGLNASRCFWYFHPSNLDFCSQFLIFARCYVYVVCISYIYVVKMEMRK